MQPPPSNFINHSAVLIRDGNIHKNTNMSTKTITRCLEKIHENEGIQFTTIYDNLTLFKMQITNLQKVVKTVEKDVLKQLKNIKKNKKNYKLQNLELLCYNCYFTHVGDIFSDKKIQGLEDHVSIYKGQVDWELDDYQKEMLARLGLEETTDPEDASDLISRI